MNDLKTISDLADKLFDAQAKVCEVEADLKAAQRAVRQLAEHDLPEAMEDVGLKSIKTQGGLIVEVKDGLQAKKLTQAHGKALDWLRANGNGGLIKTAVAVPFTAGSEDEAKLLVDRLAGEGIACSFASEVNPASLSAALRTLLEAGTEIPEYMGAHQSTKAKVTPSKK